MPTLTATTAPPPSTEAPPRAAALGRAPAPGCCSAVVWAWAAVAKMGDPAASVRAVRAYELLPEWLAKGVGYGLPFLEIGLAVLLIAGLATRLAAVLSSALLVVFLVGIISAAARGLQIECGCFGGGGQLGAGQSTAYTGEILRDAGLLAGLGCSWSGRTGPGSRVDNLIRSYGPAADRAGPAQDRRGQAAAGRAAGEAAAAGRAAGPVRVGGDRAGAGRARRHRHRRPGVPDPGPDRTGAGRRLAGRRRDRRTVDRAGHPRPVRGPAVPGVRPVRVAGRAGDLGLGRRAARSRCTTT